MNSQPTALDRIGMAMKLPFSIFSDDAVEDDDHMVRRLDEMHIHMPKTLPEKRFFKH